MTVDRIKAGVGVAPGSRVLARSPEGLAHIVRCDQAGIAGLVRVTGAKID
jgi:hypothetical protein